jgi:hypothetical protein
MKDVMRGEEEIMFFGVFFFKKKKKKMEVRNLKKKWFTQGERLE